MSVNVDLLRRTLAHIEQHPEQHNQDTWRCETTMCFAGWAATLAGGKWASEDPDSRLYERLVPEVDDPKRDRSPAFPGIIVRPFTRAQRILGLTDEQADELFLNAETIDDVRRIVGELCVGAA